MRTSALIAILGTLFVTGCTTTGVNTGTARVVLDGKTLKVDSFGSLNPECGSLGTTTVLVTEEPKHGKVSVQQGMDYPRFSKENIRAHCNMKRAPATLVFYTPSPGYKGSDSFKVEAVFPNGNTRNGTYQLDVR